ncbi:hypothetical protein THAOC_14924, partial [Thalassiosira oceanica]
SARTAGSNRVRANLQRRVGGIRQGYGSRRSAETKYHQSNRVSSSLSSAVGPQSTEQRSVPIVPSHQVPLARRPEAAAPFELGARPWYFRVSVSRARSNANGYLASFISGIKLALLDKIRTRVQYLPPAPALAPSRRRRHIAPSISFTIPACWTVGGVGGRTSTLDPNLTEGLVQETERSSKKVTWLDGTDAGTGGQEPSENTSRPGKLSPGDLAPLKVADLKLLLKERDLPQLMRKSKNELKDLLKSKGLKHQGNKQLLVDRLFGREVEVQSRRRIDKWEKSKARKLLLEMLRDERSWVHKMQANEVYESHKWFQDYPLANFKRYFEDMKAAAQKYKEKGRIEIMRSFRWSSKIPSE